jgi:hypothetical protein
LRREGDRCTLVASNSTQQGHAEVDEEKGSSACTSWTIKHEMCSEERGSLKMLRTCKHDNRIHESRKMML